MEDDEGRGGQADEGETCGVEMVSLSLLAGRGRGEGDTRWSDMMGVFILWGLLGQTSVT